MFVRHIKTGTDDAHINDQNPLSERSWFRMPQHTREQKLAKNGFQALMIDPCTAPASATLGRQSMPCALSHRNLTHCENQSKSDQNAWKIQEVMRDSLGFSHLPDGLTRCDFHT
jgi:hypothetical protein